MDKIKTCLVLWTALLSIGTSGAFEMHFEQKDAGFFIRRSTAASPFGTSTSFIAASAAPSSSSEETGESDGRSDKGDPLTLKMEHFTVLPSNQPVSIRVNYGPFSTKQTVPVRLLVPDPIDSNPFNGTAEPEMIPPLDLSAHIVTPTIPKDTPILRVLFHAGQTAFGLQQMQQQPFSSSRSGRQQAPGASGRSKTRLCLVAQATKSTGDQVSSSCSPDSRDSTCLAELTLPTHWWPNTPPAEEPGTGSASVKPTKIAIQVTYAVYEPENGHCNEIGLSTTYGAGIIGEGSGKKRIQIQPPTALSTVLLVDAQKSYRVVKADASEAVKLLVPEGSIYPHAKFYVPVIVGKHDHRSIVAFIMRARVRSGLRILGIEPTIEKTWNITTDFNPRRTHATIAAVRKFDPRFQDSKGDVEEVFNWILEAAEETTDDWDGGRVVWILRYVIQPPGEQRWMNQDPFAEFTDERHKLTTRLEVQKDSIQSVIPIAKSWEVLNTAVLNGKQVSQPLKIFIVSHAGKVADVTLQATCKSLDESVLKVSSSCTSVYVDGSEIRGSTNATISIKYDTIEGTAHFTVWMPEFPLDIQLSDSKLSQIKGWKIPVAGRREGGKRTDADGLLKMMGDEATVGKKETRESSSPAEPTEGGFEGRGTWDEPEEEQVDDDDDLDTEEEIESQDKSLCRSRYQHARIDIYGRFLAQDHDSGRTSYFISRKTYLKVTDLIGDYVRVSDPQIAVIKGYPYTVQGVTSGKTEVQIVSPVTGRVLGAEEVRVVNDRVYITSMKVQVSSGVQLSLYPDSDSENEYVAETTITSKLSAKYQEALLDIKLRFSDNTWMRLDEIDRENYILGVDSLEPSVVELPQIQNSKYPRILAVNEGSGPIMRVSLELSDQCHGQNTAPLAVAVAQVDVNFTSGSSRSEFTQNDSSSGQGSSSKHSFRKPSRKEKFGEAPAGGLYGESDGVIKKEIGKKGKGGTANDIAGMPLRDDSSKAAIPPHSYGISVGFGDKSWSMSAHNTPLQIAIYVLLGVFTVAILVFVASCVVYASRVKKREYSSTNLGDVDALGIKMAGRTNTATMNPTHNDWVWLGRASLALHPSLDSSKHSRTNVNFENGVNPMRIIANPSFDRDGQTQEQVVNNSFHSELVNAVGIGRSQLSLQSNASSLHGTNPFLSNSRPFVRGGSSGDAPRLAPPPPRPPKPGQQQTAAVGGIDSSTYSVKAPAAGSGGRPVPTNPFQQQQNNVDSPTSSLIMAAGTPGSIASGSGQSPPSGCPDYRPPVPPHRNLASSPPPISPPNRPGTGGSNYSSHSSTSNGSKYTKDPIDDDIGGATAAELMKRSNIVANPMCYIDEEDEDLEEPLAVAAAVAAAARHKNHNHHNKSKNNTNVKLDMDYDQLMEYFDNLKETEA